MSLTCGARSSGDVDWSTINMGRVSNGLWWARVGPVWAGPTRTRGMLWCCHVVAKGLYWAMVYGSRSTVDACAGLRWTESTLLLSSAVHVHRVQARTAGEGSLPCFSRGCAPAGDVLAGEPPWRRWCPIGEGKGFPRPRRSGCWGLSGGRGLPGRWPRRLAARQCSPVVRSRM